MNICTVICCALFWSVGCNNELDRSIKIILPNDFRGEFCIVKDRDGMTADVTPEYYEFEIPESGELHIRSIDPFFKWHKLRVEHVDGRVLFDDSKDLFSNNGLSIESQGTTTGQRKTGPSSWEGSTDYDGTTMRWIVTETH